MRIKERGGGNPTKKKKCGQRHREVQRESYTKTETPSAALTHDLDTPTPVFCVRPGTLSTTWFRLLHCLALGFFLIVVGSSEVGILDLLDGHGVSQIAQHFLHFD